MRKLAVHVKGCPNLCDPHHGFAIKDHKVICYRTSSGSCNNPVPFHSRSPSRVPTAGPKKVVPKKIKAKPAANGHSDDDVEVVYRLANFSCIYN